MERSGRDASAHASDGAGGDGDLVGRVRAGGRLRSVGAKRCARRRAVTGPRTKRSSSPAAACSRIAACDHRDISSGRRPCSPCGRLRRSPTRELDGARARWQSAALAGYEYGYHKYCECHRESPPETIVTVRDGTVVGVRHRPAGSTTEVPAADKNFEYYWTVDGLFGLIASALERGVQVRARTTPRSGSRARSTSITTPISSATSSILRLTGRHPPRRRALDARRAMKPR